MTRTAIARSLRTTTILLSANAMLLLAPTISRAQMITFSNQDLLDYTSQNPFGRLPDGRPKVPDDLIERARGLSAEEIWAGLEDKKFRNQYADGLQVLHPGKTLAGRAFTVEFIARALRSGQRSRSQGESAWHPATHQPERD